MRINTGRWWAWATYIRARFRIRRASLWHRRYALARSSAAGFLSVSLTVLVLFGSPVVDVTQLHRSTGLLVVYVLFTVIMWLLITWALSEQSPVVGLSRRHLRSASRADGEGQK
jgi:hypothetical protein